MPVMRPALFKEAILLWFTGDLQKVHQEDLDGFRVRWSSKIDKYRDRPMRTVTHLFKFENVRMALHIYQSKALRTWPPNQPCRTIDSFHRNSDYGFLSTVCANRNYGRVNRGLESWAGKDVLRPAIVAPKLKCVDQL